MRKRARTLEIVRENRHFPKSLLFTMLQFSKERTISPEISDGIEASSVQRATATLDSEEEPSSESLQENLRNGTKDRLLLSLSFSLTQTYIHTFALSLLRLIQNYKSRASVVCMMAGWRELRTTEPTNLQERQGLVKKKQKLKRERRGKRQRLEPE